MKPNSVPKMSATPSRMSKQTKNDGTKTLGIDKEYLETDRQHMIPNSNKE